LPRARRQSPERAYQARRFVGSRERRRGIGPAVHRLRAEQQGRKRDRTSQRRPAPYFAGRPRDHAEHERPETRAPVEAGATIEELQVTRLEHILGSASIPAAAAQRPAERRDVQLLELVRQVGR